MRSASVLLGAVIACAALPALALMPPEAYEAARDNAPNVIVIEVKDVVEPEEGWGICRVFGTVVAVERGTLFGAGEAVTLDVDCRRDVDAEVPVGGTIYQDTPMLMEAPYGRAYIDDAGWIVASQYERLGSAETKH